MLTKASRLSSTHVGPPLPKCGPSASTHFMLREIERDQGGNRPINERMRRIQVLPNSEQNVASFSMNTPQLVEGGTDSRQ